MRSIVSLPLDCDAYPSKLRALPTPPPNLYLSGSPLIAGRVVAIVGTRHPDPACEAFARTLATQLARAGIVIVSGGAAGIDTAAHEATLAAGGRTWLVAPTGDRFLYPPENRPLFDRIRSSSEGAVIWPFEPDARPLTFRFWIRNGVMVALADALVVIQAGIPSGTLNAAKWARQLDKPVWVVPTPPWIDGCDGSWSLLESGARPLWSIPRFLKTLLLNPDLSEATATLDKPPISLVIERTPEETLVLRAIADRPKHVDQIALESGVSISPLMTALLTLALEDVVVEGPSGFYCRCK